MRKAELAERIKSSIEDFQLPLWFPNLTPQLAEIGWQLLKAEFELTALNYSTSKILSDNVYTPSPIIPFKDKSGEMLFSVELLPKELADNYSDSEIDFYDAVELPKKPLGDCLTEAIELIKNVPSLSESVFKLIRTVHLIKLVDDDYDVSFSEPQLPFSIFVSVPKSRIKADFLRVAEAIVHEAMHLQLSLIEKVVPLVSSNEQKFYSPWKDEYRNSTGILHALYVFRVIESFYGQFGMKQDISPIDLDFIKSRRTEIFLQIREVSEFSRSSDLTEYGLRLTKRLLS